MHLMTVFLKQGKWLFSIKIRSCIFTINFMRLNLKRFKQEYYIPNIIYIYENITYMKYILHSKDNKKI